MLLAELTTGDKWGIITGIVIGVAGLGSLVVSIIAAARKQEIKFERPVGVRLDQEEPVKTRQAGKKYNHDLVESRHDEMMRRLDSHEAEIESLWTTMRREDMALRESNSEKFESIMATLGEIKGELKRTK